MNKKDEKNEIMMSDVDLEEYISPLFIEELDKAFGHSCVIPIRMIICTCKGDGKDIKSFILEYPEPEDYEKTTVQIYSSAGVEPEDIKKLRKVFDNAKI